MIRLRRAAGGSNRLRLPYRHHCAAGRRGNRASGHVRTEVSKKMHIRKAPRFIFVEDDGAAYAAHINELLRELNVNGDSEQPSQTEE